MQTKEGQEATGGRNGKSGGSNTSSGGEAATVDVPTPAVTGSGKVYTEEKITKPTVSENSATLGKNTYRTKAELDKMPTEQLRKETAELAKTWYSSGKSGISFGNSDIDSVVNKLVDGAGRTSLTKDYMSLKKRLSSLDNGGGSGIMKSKEPVSIFLNSSERLFENAQKVEPIPGYQDIVIHGDKTGFAYKDKDGNETLLNVSEFSKILKESGLYQGGKVRLISCETAADGAHTAQWLADDLGVEILAPSDVVWIDHKGNMTIGPDEYTNSGTWVTIKPSRKE